MHQKAEARENKGLAELWLKAGTTADILTSEPMSVAFTPTTFAAIESTLTTLDSVMSSDYSSDEDSNSNSAFTSNRKMTMSGPVSSTTANKQLPGPKSSIRTQDLTPSEQHRRQRRRERNKLAAARCRQRRLDLTNQLLEETQQLEAESRKLEQEIENLRKQRDQLQFVLEAHQPMCRGDIKTENDQMDDSTGNVAVMSAVRPSSLPISTQVAPATDSFGTGLSFDFDLGSTGYTPLVSTAGANVFLGSSANFVSPTTLVMSPSLLL